MPSLSPHSDEFRDLIKLTVLSIFGFKYIRDYLGLVLYMLVVFLALFGHSLRQNTDLGRPFARAKVGIFSPRFLKILSSILLFSLLCQLRYMMFLLDSA